MRDALNFLAFLIIAIAIIRVIVTLVSSKRNKKIKNKIDDVEFKKPFKHKCTHEIVCPFCYEEFTANNVRFRFKLDDAIVYLSASQTHSETLRFLKNKNLSAKIKTDKGMPNAMVLINKSTGAEIATSPLRVCAKENCNAVLSTAAGTYSPDNGLFLLGLKSSGKTVYISSVINRLNEVIPKFKCVFTPYNAQVSKDYTEKYYKKMFVDKLLPDATVNPDQLTYEIHNTENNKVVGLTFSDIKGEISGSPQEVFNESVARVVGHSNYFLVTIDVKDIENNDYNRMLNEAIFQNVLIYAARKPEKYLAVVLTKSDELINYDSERHGAEIFEPTSPIFSPVDYGHFDVQRKSINEKIKAYMEVKYPQLIYLAKNAFLENNINYFAVSSLGGPPVGGKCPDIIKTLRVEEPVLWLLKKSGVLN